MQAHLAHVVGDVKEFGFRPIPEDGNYASHFSGDTSTPKADSGDADQTFSDSRPADSESDLIDLGQGESKGSEQEGTRDAVSKAISDADSASKHCHPHLHHRHHEQQQQPQGEPAVIIVPPLAEVVNDQQAYIMSCDGAITNCDLDSCAALQLRYQSAVHAMGLKP